MRVYLVMESGTFFPSNLSSFSAMACTERTCKSTRVKASTQLAVRNYMEKCHLRAIAEYMIYTCVCVCVCVCVIRHTGSMDAYNTLLTLGTYAHSDGYCSCPVCVCVYVCMCVSTHICRLTHWNHKREIRTNGFTAIQRSF